MSLRFCGGCHKWSLNVDHLRYENACSFKRRTLLAVSGIQLWQFSMPGIVWKRSWLNVNTAFPEIASDEHCNIVLLARSTPASFSDGPVFRASDGQAGFIVLFVRRKRLAADNTRIDIVPAYRHTPI